MICLILLTILSCQSTNYYELAGIKNELFTRREGTAINDSINYRAIDRAFDTSNKDKEKKEKEVSEMGESEVVTMITSIIAGLYAVVKTIIDLINKFKKNKK